MLKPIKSTAALFSTSLLLLAMHSLLTGCSPIKALNAVIPNSGYQLTSDIPFDSHPRQKLDVYIPKKTPNKISGKTPELKSTKLPVIVFFYGGSWDSGDKASYKFIGEAFTSQGFIAVIPDYRVYPEVLFPGFMADPAKAAKWVKDHAAEFGGDPERIFLAGHSAGAHIAAMLVLDQQFLNADDSSPKDFAGMIGLAGPYDFLPLQSQRLKTIFGPEEQRAQSQPVNFVTGKNPPMLLLVGTKDDTVWPKNTYNLAAKVKAAGGSVEVAEFQGYSHIDMAAKLAKPLRNDRLLDTIAHFVESH